MPDIKSSESMSFAGLCSVSGVGGPAVGAAEATRLVGCEPWLSSSEIASAALRFLVEGGMVADEGARWLSSAGEIEAQDSLHLLAI